MQVADDASNRTLTGYGSRFSSRKIGRTTSRVVKRFVAVANDLPLDFAFLLAFSRCSSASERTSGRIMQRFTCTQHINEARRAAAWLAGSREATTGAMGPRLAFRSSLGDSSHCRNLGSPRTRAATSAASRLAASRCRGVSALKKFDMDAPASEAPPPSVARMCIWSSSQMSGCCGWTGKWAFTQKRG